MLDPFNKEPLPSESFDTNKARNELTKKYGLQFIDATHERLPEQFDLNQIVVDQEKRRKIESEMNLLLRFLKSPVITDTLGDDHKKRREMRTDIELNYGPRYKGLVDENKLRANNRGTALLNLDNLATYLNLQLQLESLKARLEKNFPNRFNDLELADKIKYVEELEKIIINFLNIIIEKLEKDRAEI